MALSRPRISSRAPREPTAANTTVPRPISADSSSGSMIGFLRRVLPIFSGSMSTKASIGAPSLNRCFDRRRPVWPAPHTTTRSQSASGPLSRYFALQRRKFSTEYRASTRVSRSGCSRQKYR